MNHNFAVCLNESQFNVCVGMCIMVVYEICMRLCASIQFLMKCNMRYSYRELPTMSERATENGTNNNKV